MWVLSHSNLRSVWLCLEAIEYSAGFGIKKYLVSNLLLRRVAMGTFLKLSGPLILSV